MGKIEQQVQALSSDELASFREWFADFEAAAWDRQLEADLKTGKQDKYIAEARAEFKAGKVREL